MIMKKSDTNSYLLEHFSVTLYNEVLDSNLNYMETFSSTLFGKANI